MQNKFLSLLSLCFFFLISRTSGAFVSTRESRRSVAYNGVITASAVPRPRASFNATSRGSPYFASEAVFSASTLAPVADYHNLPYRVDETEPQQDQDVLWNDSVQTFSSKEGRQSDEFSRSDQHHSHDQIYPDYFNEYSQQQLNDLQAQCYQYHYHYGPLYGVSRAINVFSNAMQDSVYHTARQLYHSANKYGGYVGNSVGHFGRYMGGNGGRVLVIVVMTGLTLLGISIIQLYFTLLGVQNGGKRKRAEDGQDLLAGRSQRAGPGTESGYDAINVLYLLEDAFQKLELSDPGCQQRVICEAHEANAEYKYGAVAGKLQKIIGSLDVKTTADMNQEASGVFNMFRNAAIRGIQQQDCQEVYSPKCSKGLRELVRDSTKL